MEGDFIMMKCINQKRELYSKALLTGVCCITTLLGVKLGFVQNGGVIEHFAYPFCHANIWHLVINLYVLWKLRNHINPLSSYMIAVLVSFLPMYVTDPTMGLSGFLFASIGQMWAKANDTKRMCQVVLPFILITMLIPNTNGLLHLYAFVVGYFYKIILFKV